MKNQLSIRYDRCKCQIVDFSCGPDFSVAVVELNGIDPEDDIFRNFRYSNVDNVKKKMLKVASKTRKHLEQTKDNLHPLNHNKISNLNNELLKKMVEHYVDKTELFGFASLREESKHLIVKDMINKFLRDELNMEEYSTEMVRLNKLCEDMGMNFEHIFYDRIMKDPTVIKEMNEQNLLRGIKVIMIHLRMNRPKSHIH